MALDESTTFSKTIWCKYPVCFPNSTPARCRYFSCCFTDRSTVQHIFCCCKHNIRFSSAVYQLKIFVSFTFFESVVFRWPPVRYNPQPSPVGLNYNQSEQVNLPLFISDFCFSTFLSIYGPFISSTKSHHRLVRVVSSSAGTHHLSFPISHLPIIRS